MDSRDFIDRKFWEEKEEARGENLRVNVNEEDLFISNMKKREIRAIKHGG